jgi:DnaK suppressor protein
MIAEKEKQSLKVRLERERQQLTEEIRRLDTLVNLEGQYHDTESGGVGNHIADDASDTFEQEKYVALRRNTERILDEVNHSLHQIENGSYGQCENCDQEIPIERLEALPWAKFCIGCQSKEENRRGR